MFEPCVCACPTHFLPFQAVELLSRVFTRSKVGHYLSLNGLDFSRDFKSSPMSPSILPHLFGKVFFSPRHLSLLITTHDVVFDIVNFVSNYADTMTICLLKRSWLRRNEDTNRLCHNFFNDKR
jgi:hypothetical protein